MILNYRFPFFLYYMKRGTIFWWGNQSTADLQVIKNTHFLDINYQTYRLNEIHKSVKEISSRSNTKYYNFIGASHLVGNARLASSQVSESSKILSFYSEMPEACHNLIEGYSGDNYDINTIILGSDNYHVQINKRFATFKDLVEDMNLPIEVVHFPKASKFGEGIFYLFFSSLLSLELAKKYREDPISIPHVEKIKRN